MSQIQEFIKDDLQGRLKKAGSLVFYDHDRRFHELCLDLANEETEVIDASEGSLESRLAALTALRKLGVSQRQTKALVYVPARKPITTEQKQLDPFSFYAECGAAFPEDDGDEFLNLCLRAKPDHATEIRHVFAQNPSPSFAVVDAIGGGVDWPQLRATLNVESARHVMAALLAPTKDQSAALKSQEGWTEEARDFLKATIGLNLKTRAKSHGPIYDELWRYLLFSEFVFDLPGALPEALAGVPHAPIEARPFIEDICEGLRNDLRKRTLYMERADAVETELNLAQLCSGIEDLGQKDTFWFEERTFLKRAIDGLINDNTDQTREVLKRQATSVWLGKGESQSQWALLQAALDLIEACADFERQLPDHSRNQESLLDFYVGSLREADRLQREFEQSVGDSLDSSDPLNIVVQTARARYGRLAEKYKPFS